MPGAAVPDAGAGEGRREEAMVMPGGPAGVGGPALLSEGGLGATYVPMGPGEAASLVHLLYGIDGVATRMATEKDDTFRIDAGSSRLVLKVANPSEDPSHLDFEVSLLEHLARTGGTPPVPRVVPAPSGQACTEVLDRAGQVRRVRLLTYLDGSPWERQASDRSQRELVGEALAALRSATAGFGHPAESRAVAWDARRVLGLAYLLDDVVDPLRRHRLAAGLDRIAELQPAISALRTQVLHNDFNKSNLLVDPGAKSFLTGILDFGDAVRTAVAVDVATAVLNQLTPATDADADIFGDGRDLLRGYRRRADLTEAEVALVPHLVMARVIARALITTHRARRFPDNAAYILRNTPPSWAQLDWFLSRSSDDVSQVLL